MTSSQIEMFIVAMLKPSSRNFRSNLEITESAFCFQKPL